ncbi:putative transcription elongation factor SPT5-like protein 1 [Nymphaea thermarum]|nr:putative transcription elongation factor SPT5-like protein 1 [Nymphaea thermarum]
MGRIIISTRPGHRAGPGRPDEPGSRPGRPIGPLSPACPSGCSARPALPSPYLDPLSPADLDPLSPAALPTLSPAFPSPSGYGRWVQADGPHGGGGGTARGSGDGEGDEGGAINAVDFAGVLENNFYREMNFPVERIWDLVTGSHFEIVCNNIIKDGYFYKVISVKSITSQISQPTLDELKKFGMFGDDASDDMVSLSSLFANRKQGHFVKTDVVVVVQGYLIRLKGRVDKVEENNVQIRESVTGVPLALRQRIPSAVPAMDKIVKAVAEFWWRRLFVQIYSARNNLGQFFVGEWESKDLAVFQ